MVRRLSILLALLVVAAGSIFGRRITEEQATAYARNWWLQKDGPRLAVLEPVATEFPNIYLFVDTAGHGFVMLSADDRSLPVLGYSLSNDFSVGDMPAAVHDWVQGYNDQIQYLIDNNIEKTAEINAQWQDLNNPVSQLPSVYQAGRGPLLQTKWGQDEPFNYQCPKRSTYYTSDAGCVATAMAQIMKYYRHPIQGIGNHSYTYTMYNGTTVVFSADYGATTYDWDNMPDVYRYHWEGNYLETRVNDYSDAERDAVATLIKHIGVAVEMNYGSYSSSNTVASTYEEPAAVNAYKKYFRYKWTARSVCMDDYTEVGWKNLLKAEIDSDRPIQYGGIGGSGGHSFVCDGYSTEGHFHFNWGWSGQNNGYYYIGALDLNPTQYESFDKQYNDNNYAVIGIEPDLNSGGSSVVTVNVNDASLGSVSGAGTYTASQLVELVPQANVGCKFVGWSNGSRDVPLKFMANGDNVTLTANFERLGGDTLNYCNDSYIKLYGAGNPMYYWGIKIPASSLSTAGDSISDIMFFAPLNGTYYIYISEGNFDVTTSVCSLNVTTASRWYSVTLENKRYIDKTQDLCVAIQSNYSPSSMPAATSYSSYSKTGTNQWINQKNAGNADVAWMIKVVAISGHKIAINKKVVRLTSLSRNVDLSVGGGLGRSNVKAPVSYSLVSCNPQGIATMSSDGYHISATGVGTVRIKASATHNAWGYAETEVDLPVGRGVLEWVGNETSDWHSAANWKPYYDVVPDSVNFDVWIHGNCRIDDAVQCNNLMFTGLYSQLAVASSAQLNVSRVLDVPYSQNLLIEADEHGCGTVIFGIGSPSATVRMYMKGTTDASGRNPQWQLRGSIVGYDFAPDKWDASWSNIRAYEWIESENADAQNGCWSNQRMDGLNIKLQPWKGYGLANYSVKTDTLEYTGTLLNDDQTWYLTKTGSGNANVGNNMLTNSYSAPIPINKLRFDNAKSSVIFYNTGSWFDWNTYHGDTITNTGTLKGQMLVCPKWTAGPAGLPDKIPSGQSFYVVADSHLATVSVSYSDVAASASGPMFAPAADYQFNVLGVTISGSKGGDRAVLIECDECTDNYDDGYDGMKYFGSGGLPQLFVANAFGNTSINAAHTITGQKMGVYTSASGDTLTMKFETAKLSGYSRLKVKDLVNGHYVDVMAGEEYQFVTTGNDAARFEILGSGLDDDHETVGQVNVVGNTIHAGDYEGVIAMYDMSGRLVWQTVVERNSSVELPELLRGVYVIKSDCSTIKIVK